MTQSDTDVPINVVVNTAIGAIVPHNQRARRLRSAVWNDFTKERRADGNCVAICNHCQKQLTATSRSGTTHLRNHLAICTSTRRLLKRRKLVVRRLTKGSNSYGKLDGADDENGLEQGQESARFDQEVSRQDLARMIVRHGYRFSIVNDVGFQTFVKNLQPQFKMVPIDTLRDDCLGIYEHMRFKLREELGKIPCRVGLLVDTWQSNSGMEYLCLTCQYVDHVDEEWRIRKKTLSFLHLEAPFTSFTPEQIANLVLDKLLEWGLDQKVSSVMVDTCIAGEIIAEDLHNTLKARGILLPNGLPFHVHSCAHILNITVQESLEQVCDLTNRLRAIIHHVRSSEDTFIKFQKFAKHIGATPRQLVLDSPNNWASLYSMFESACQWQDAFVHFAELDKYPSFLSPKDWADVKALTEILDVLYQTMEKFQSVDNPTSNLHFNEMCGIHLLLKAWCTSPSDVVAAVASQMLLKFESYWDSTRTVTAFASILDPRYKMKSLEYFFKRIYSKQFEATARIDCIQKAFINLYNEYAVESASSSENPAILCYAGSNGACSISGYGKGEDSRSFSRITLSDAQRGLDQYIQETSSGQSPKSDLDLYLEEGVYRPKEGLADNFNILTWWRCLAAKYPVLSMMARDILAIPVSVVPLDSEARTLEEYFSSMDPQTAQGLICAQSWLQAEAEAGRLQSALVEQNVFSQREPSASVN